MSRYLDSIRYFAVLLAVLFALTDGDLHGVHLYYPHCTQQSEHGDYDDEEHAVFVQRSVVETVSLSKNVSAVFVSFVSVVPVDMNGYRDNVTVSPSALSLRLHLLYRSLLI
jgi:hypothetical protein